MNCVITESVWTVRFSAIANTIIITLLEFHSSELARVRSSFYNVAQVVSSSKTCLTQQSTIKNEIFFFYTCVCHVNIYIYI